MRNMIKTRVISAFLILCMFVGILPAVTHLAQAAGTAAEAVGEGISVMSFNVMDDCEPKSDGTFPYEAPAVRENAIADMIQAYQPDIIGMQEAGDGGTSGILDWCSALDEDLKSIYDHRSLTDETGYYMDIGRGLIIFYKKSRFTLLESGAKGYSKPINNRRCYQWVKLRDNQTGVEFYIFNTHWHVSGSMTLEENEEIRTLQMQELADKVNSLTKGQPAILAGDFNSFYAPKNSMGDMYNITRLQEKTGYVDALMSTTEKHSISADGTKTALQSDDSGLMTSADHVVYSPDFYVPVKMERILSRTYTPKLSDHDAFLVEFNYRLPNVTASADEGTLDVYFSNGAYYIDNLSKRTRDLSVRVQIPSGEIFSDAECTQSVGTELSIKCETSNTYMAQNSYYIKFGNLVYPLYLRSCNSNTIGEAMFVDPSFAGKAPGSFGLYCDKWYCRKVTVGVNGFATIQEAVDAAYDGYRVMVAPGTYTEDVTYSGKSLEFYGSNRNNSKALVIKDGQLTVNTGRTYETYLSGSITFNFGALQTGSLMVNGFHFIDSTAKGQITITGGNVNKTVALRISNNLFNCYTDGAPYNGSAIHANTALQKTGSIEDNYFHLTNIPTYINEDGEIVNYTNRGITIRNMKDITINANYFDGYTGNKIKPIWLTSEVSDGSTVAGYGNVALTANRFENCKNATVSINNIHDATNANVFIAGNSYGGEKLAVNFSDTAKQNAQNIPSDKSKITFFAQTEDVPHLTVLPASGSGISTQEFSHFVTFRNDKGDVIYAHCAVDGTKAVYEGSAPAKAPSNTSCYSFERWVDADGNEADLSNVTETSEVYAEFAEADHPIAVNNQVAPTCTENGYSGDLECTVCGNAARGKVVLSMGHSTATLAAVPATCTEAGLTEGQYCSVCNEVLVPQAEIPASGHSYTKTVNNGDGTHSSSCACGYVATEAHQYTYTTTDTGHSAACLCGHTVAAPTATNGAVGKEVASLGNVYIREDDGTHASAIQGMAIAGDYVYTALVRKGPKDANGNRESLYTELIRIDLRTNEREVIVTDYYSDTNKIGLGHANDMAAVCYGDYTYLMVTRYKRSITMLKINGEGVIQETKTVVWKGSTDELQAEIAADTMGTSGIAVTSSENGIAKILIANFNRFYTAEIDLENMKLHSNLEFAFELDEADIGSVVQGTLGACGDKFTEGAAGWGYQGFSYNRELCSIFMPVTAVESREKGHEYRSVVIVIDEAGKILPKASFALHEYSLEPEEIDFYGSDLYWSTMCYSPVENDCGIDEANRIYKMPMAYLDAFSDATQDIQWTTNKNRVTNMQIENDCLNLTVAKQSVSATSGPWIRNNLRILFTQTELMTIRFRLENCTVLDPSNHKMRFSISADSSSWTTVDVPVTCVDGWYVATAAPSEAMKALEVKYLQTMFLGVSGVDETSRIVIDYIYIGAEANAPDASKYRNIRFVNEDGTLLESSSVLNGTDAVYNGDDPTKTADENSHYIFSGWDKPLSSITADTVFTATYAQKPHSWGEGSVSTQATCTTEGTRIYTCSVCNCTKAENLIALGHSEVVDTAVEATCTETGLTEGKHCDRCGEVLTAQEVIPATGHVNTSTNTTDATCTEDGSVVVTCACGEVVSTEIVAATGHAYRIVIVEPTCIDRGCTIYICACGDNYTENEVPPLGHSYDEGAITTAPTCTADGEKLFTCGVCGDTTTETVPATGHVNTSTETTDATCTEAGSVVVTCACGELISTEIVAALGHSYGYTNNGDDHSITCGNCDYNVTEGHNYVDGTCICGAVEVTEPTVDGKISIGETLSLESDLTMNLRIKTSQLSAYDLSTAYLVVERDVYNSNGTMEVETRTLTDYTFKDNRLVFAYTGISAAQMNDEIRVVLHIKDASGKEYKSNQKVTSVAIYSDLMLGASAGNEKLITLIMDMLNYGTAAQIYYKRHADAPVNEAFESFRTYASYASTDLKSALEDMSGTISNGNASATITQGLDLSTRVGITYKVKLPAGVDAASARLIIKDANGNALESFDLSTGTVDSKDRYCVTFFGSNSREMRRVVYATVMVDGAAISDTYSYTISSYAHTIANTAGMPEALVNLTRLMVIYGDSADAYFG